LLVFSFGFLLSGCSSEATPEQLSKIKELEAEVISLNQSITAKESDKAGLERDISAIESKLQDCEKEKQLVKERLATWKEPVPVETEKPAVDKKTAKKKKAK
jgi:outer membrane murein-binding lipoprotein Lpp